MAKIEESLNRNLSSPAGSAIDGTRQAAPGGDRSQAWSRSTTLVIEHLPIPYFLLAFIAAAWVGSEQVFEYLCETGMPWNLSGCVFGPPSNAIAGNVVKYFVLPALTLYMLVMLRILKRTAVGSLAELRPAVLIDDEAYDGLVYRMVSTNRRLEIALLFASIVGVYLIFVLFDIPLAVTTNSHAAEFGAGALFILSAYVLFGWAFLTLVTSAFQIGNALGRLAHRPLAVNIYDHGNLLPFGHIALVYSLTLVGVILILLIGLGHPTQLSSWATIIILSSASLAALVVPLWGVNRQMRESRHVELARIHEQLKNLHETLLSPEAIDSKELADSSSRVMSLVNLRKVVLETPTWPYRDTLTIIRAIAIAIAPILYFVLTQIIANLITGK